MTIELKRIADMVNGRLIGDPECPITGAGPIDQASQGQITFAEKGSGLKRINQTRASAVLVPMGYVDAPPNLIQVENPRVAFAKVLAHFNPCSVPQPGIHPSAAVGKHCTIGKDVSIAAGVVIGDHVRLGDRAVLHPNVVIADRAVIGDDTVIYPNASILERCTIGCRVIINAGCVVGSEGFGFVFDKGRHMKIPQIGIVQIDDDVEVGANTTIDRAAIGKTWIKTGAKIDNLVQIAHNVTIGEHSIVVAQVGIAGSTTIGNHVILAGKAAISGHITIADGVTVGPRGSVAQSITEKQIVSSANVAVPHGKWLRIQRDLPDLPDLKKKVSKLEKQMAQIIEDKQ